MIRLVFILALFLGASNSNEYAIEDEIYACMQSNFAERNIDLDYYLDEVEADLIEQEVLLDGTGESKLAFFQNIAKDDVFVDITCTPAMDTLSKDLDLNNINEVLTCSESDLIIVFGDSSIHQYFKKSEKLKEEYALITASCQVSPAQVAKAISNVYTAEDYNHPLYRARMLILAAISSEKHLGFIKDESKLKKQKINLNDKVHAKAMKIYLSEQIDSIRIERQLYTNFENIEEVFANYFRSSTYSHIYLKLSQGTPYGVLIEVLQTMEKQHEDFIYEIAHEKFNKPYIELSEDEQNKINQEYPLKVIENTLK